MTERFKIPISEKGRIVGKSFRTKDFLQQNTHCDIYFGNYVGRDVEVAVTGPESWRKIATNWVKHMANIPPSELKIGPNIKRRTLTIPEDKVPLFIGTGGSGLDMLRYEYHAQVKYKKVNGVSTAIVYAHEDVIESCMQKINIKLFGGPVHTFGDCMVIRTK